MVGRLRHLDDATDVGHDLALGDQLLGGFELADDLLRCMPGAFHGEVPGPIWPAEDSRSPWSDFQGQRQFLRLLEQHRPVELALGHPQSSVDLPAEIPNRCADSKTNANIQDSISRWHGITLGFLRATLFIRPDLSPSSFFLLHLRLTLLSSPLF